VMVTAGGAVELGRTSSLVAFTTATVPSREVAERIPPAIQPAGAYHDVVFRAPSGSGAVVSRNPETQVIPAETVCAPGRAAQPVALAARKTATHPRTGAGNLAVFPRASFATEDNAGWIVVTRWESSADRQAPAVVIQSIFRFTTGPVGPGAADAAQGVSFDPATSGWFVFQL
jgi:hypothetical protein